MSIANTVLPATGSTRANRANPRQKAQRAETRDRLIAGAIRVFADRGYAHASVEDVLIESCVSRATFYSHFPGKPALAEAIADGLVPAWQPLYDELAHMVAPSLAQLEEWCGRSLALYRTHQDVCIILTQASTVEPDLYWKLTAHRKTITLQMARCNPALSHLRDDPSAQLRAALALLQLDQACYYIAIHRWQDPDAAGIEAMAMHLHHFLETEARRGAAS